MSGLYKAALGLVIVGALNWLLVGLFNWNLVGAIFGGDMSVLSRIIYTVVGICGLISIGILARNLDAKPHAVHGDREVRRVA
ncbi:MAG TPA: DUF378 domain-containing protein [Terriglobales bacterium]|nr:DUF378 domain-containing protein [Terriglobales bacterium]